MHTIHECELVYTMLKESEKTDAKQKGYVYDFGEAFDTTFTNYGDSDYFWTNNNEYTNPIYFCPACGLDLRTLLNKEA